jgi:hypothetical protein
MAVTTEAPHGGTWPPTSRALRKKFLEHQTLVLSSLGLGFFFLNTQPTRSPPRQGSPFWQGLESSPPGRGRSPQGTATPRKRRCESITAPWGVTRQDDAYSRALGPTLTVVACGPVGVVTPSGKAWRPSKEEQSRIKSFALQIDIHRP